MVFPGSREQKISVIIPAWNEEATVGSIIQTLYSRFENLPLSVIVVDDASQDQTAQVGWDNRAVVISLAKHQGAWGAIQTGFRYALQKEAQVMVTMDADGQHEPASLEALIGPILTHKSDVTIGSYTQRGSPGRHLSWRIFRKLSRLTVQDLTSGLKAYNRKAASMLLNPNMHLLDYQDLGTLLYLRKNGMKIVEVPVRMQPRQYGHSRVFNSWMAVCKYLVFSTILCVSKYAQTSDNKLDSEGNS
ncbi:MAG: glycosyltransferase family 2 protein [Desulfovermiculus sp.]